MTADSWQEYKLEDVTENFDSKRIPVKKADRKSGPFPYYGASGVVDYVDSYIFDGEYLLVAEDGENLRSQNQPIAFLVRGKFWVNNHSHVISGNHLADTRYLAYLFQHFDISPFLTGSTRPKLTKGHLNQIPLVLPPINEQQAIANVLGALDDKIELNRKMNETLEAMARAIFKSWFIDFDPVRAKAEGRQPIGMDPETAALFPDSFEDSELGEIPKGWRPGKIEDIVSLARTSISPASSPTETFEHFSIPAFDDGRVPKKELGSTIKSNKYLVPADAVLISKLNPRIQRVWLPFISELRNSICSTEFLVSVSIDEVPREFVYALYVSRTFQQSFASLVTGTSGSHQRVKPEFLLDMVIVVPTQRIMKRFSEAARPLLDRVAANIAESQTLAGIRDTLLPKLLSGQIRINNAERLLEKKA